MGKRLLASFLAAAMMLTMAPFAFAVDDIDNDETPAAEEAVAGENQIETKDTSTFLQSAIDAADGSYTLTENTTADITISKDLVLDLGGNTLTNTNSGKATITVANGATVTVKKGSVVGGTGYYNIQVAAGATLTLEDVIATAGNAGSSMIDNFGTLTVESGTYTGGLNVIKNEPNATLTINNCKFELLQGYPKGVVGTIFNYGSLTIHDGEFLQSDTKTGSLYGYPQVVYTDKDKETNSTPSTTIVGGTFKNSHTNQQAWTIRSTNAATPTTTVTGGKFNKKVTSSYLPDGYASTTTKVDGYYGLATAITSVTLNETEVNLRGGESFKVQVTNVEPTSAEVKTYSMRGSGNTANFDSKTGVVTARKVGDYKVIVTPAGAGATESECVFHITEGNATVTTKNKNVIHYLTLKDAFANASSGETVTLLTDMTENVTLNPSAKKSYILNLNGHTLTNASGDTITVGAKANLTIQGEGTVDNVTHGKAAIVNNGTVTLNGGTYTRSKENPENNKDDGGGNSYYTILNDKGGNMTINSGVTVTNAGHFSSMIRNGGDEKSVLTINGGTFSGGINTVKNDAYGVLTINDGNFSNTSQFVVMNWNDATINGGTFSVNKSAQAVLFSAEYDKDCAVGELTITGGTFKGTGTQTMINTYYSADYIGTASVSGGVFTADVTKFCAPGYKTELTNGVYVVKAGTNEALDKVDTAIADGATEDQIKDDVEAVTNTPNETLSSSSTTMDKLAQLEEKVTNNKITVEAKSEVSEVSDLTATNAKLSADPGATTDQKITIDVTASNASVDEAKTFVGAANKMTAKALDITMKLNGDEITPKAPVVLTFDLPTDWANAKIVYMNGSTPELVKTSVSTDANGKATISGTFNHFSTYVLVQTEAALNPNEYEIILTPTDGQGNIVTDVSAGDTIVYTVKLYHKNGDGQKGMFTFIPDVTSGLLTGGTFTAEAGVTAEYGPVDNTNQNKLVIRNLDLAKGNTMTIGTLSYRVDAYGVDNTTIEYTANSKGTVSNNGRVEEATVTLVNDREVKYHVVKVTFQSADGTNTVGYVKYGTKAPLYKELTDLRDQTANTVSVPALDKDKTGGTIYRVLDDNWHLSTDEQQTYQNMTDFQTSVTFKENFVKLAKVGIPIDSEGNALVEIVPEDQITRRDGGNVYVDQGKDLIFKLTNKAQADAGKEYVVKAKIDNADAFEVPADTNGNYTVDKTKITGDVTITMEQKLALTKDDIKIFTDTDTTQNNAIIYRPFSVYSEKRTLVLIKGAQGAKYAFDGTAEQHPTIYATNVYEGDYTLAVLIDPTNVQTVNGTSVSEEAMLAYMVDTLKLNVVESTETVNPKIVYDYDTNGRPGEPLVDAQVARDFTEMIKGNGWYWEPGDELLLKADVITADGGDLYTEATYRGKPDGQVSPDDVATFMYLYVGMPKTSN